MTYAISDIHGCYDKYRELLRAIQFQPDDTLYVLGDVIDRGPHGFKILLDMAQRPNVIGLMGNHEAMAIHALPGIMRSVHQIGKAALTEEETEALKLWFRNGGELSLADFLWLDDDQSQVAWEYMRKMPLYQETEVRGQKFVLVHGGLDNFSASRSLSDYEPNEILWCRPEPDTVYYPDKYVVFGHTPVQLLALEAGEDEAPAKIYYKEKLIDIDCGCAFQGGQLGCLCLDNPPRQRRGPPAGLDPLHIRQQAVRRRFRHEVDESPLLGGRGDKDAPAAPKERQPQPAGHLHGVGQENQRPQPLEYPWNDALDPALEGEFTVDGRRCKTGWQLLWERVEEYTLEKAAEVCWLDAGKIEEAIHVFADNLPSGLSIGVATDQTPNSVQAAMAAATIDLLMGNVERPGALLQRFRTSGCFDMPNYPVPVAAGRLPNEQLKKRLGGRAHKGLGIWWAGHPSSILEAILTGEPYQPRVWIDRSGNKLGATADSQRWEQAIQKLDFIVHVYMYPTSFSAYADILIPAEEWLETDMLVETCNTLVARQQCTHLWETMDETLFWSKLAKRCGELGHETCAKAFDADYMGHDLPYWDSMEEFLDHWVNRLGMSWKEFAAKAPIEYLPKEQWRSYYVYQQPDPKNGGKPAGFPTPSKKCELYVESMITLGRTGRPFSPIDLEPADQDYDPLPYYMEPAESPLPGSDVAEQYPLVLTGGRVPYFHHNTLRNIPWLREMYPAPELWIHPAAAEKYGVEDGGWVWVESKRGKTQAVAKVTQGINPGTVYMERFWNPETLNTPTHGWKEMNVNMLTKSTAPFNDVVGTYTLRAFQVKVTKADGAPDGVWLDPEDFRPWLPNPVQPTEEVRV